MGLDMRPIGKPKKGFENRFKEIFEMINSDNIPKPSLLDKIRGKKYPTKDELIQEWFENQISTYETIKAQWLEETMKLKNGLKKSMKN